MKPLLVLTTALLAVQPWAAAQEMDFTPAKELKELQRWIGYWQGAGTFKSPEMPQEFKWTSVASVTWILGGHFLQEDMRVDFPGGVMPSYYMRTVVGWDRVAKEYRGYGFSNESQVGAFRMALEGEDSIVSMSLRTEDGIPVAQRWMMTFTSGDRYEFAMGGMRGIADDMGGVTGVYERVEKAEVGMQNAKAFQPPPEELKQLAGIVGKWRFKGSMGMSPGAPKVEISGVETITHGFGGQLFQIHLVGDPAPGFPDYEAAGYIVWNERQQCYDHYMMDSMGVHEVSQGRLLEKNKLVVIAAGLMYGQATANRMVLELDPETGAPVRAKGYSLMMTAEPFVSFEGTYEPAK